MTAENTAARTRAQAWASQATSHHSDWTAHEIAARRDATVTIVLPARNEAATIGAILDALLPLRENGVVDEVVVVDDSTDGTADIARARGATVHAQSALVAQIGPVQGKGDAMWRALSVVDSDIVCFLDADSDDLGPHFATGLLGPLIADPAVQFAKACYRRPFRSETAVAASGGGRVTELTARPLLNAFFPELTGFLQPLAGEIAVRRSLLERLPMLCGYAVDAGLLIDVWRQVGLDAMAQVDLDARQNRHQTLDQLGPMAMQVSAGILQRAHDCGLVAQPPPAGALMPDGARLRDATFGLIERPPRVPVGEPPTLSSS